MKKSRNILLITFSFLFVFILSGCQERNTSGEAQTETSGQQEVPNEQNPNEATLPEGDFKMDDSGGEGTLYLNGYATVSQVQEPFCEENCKTYSYVWFVFEKTANSDLQGFLEQNEGNAYVRKNETGENMIGLGCVENNIISYANDSDANGRKEITLPAELSGDILTATPEEPISLKIIKEKLTGGAGAPACYSHFTTIERYREEM